jgi:hypothetical protein
MDLFQSWARRSYRLLGTMPLLAAAKYGRLDAVRCIVDGRSWALMLNTKTVRAVRRQILQLPLATLMSCGSGAWYASLVLTSTAPIILVTQL